MDQQLIKQAKDKLLAEKERLEKELASIGKKKTDVADDYDSRFPNYGDDVDSNAAEVDTYSSRLGVERNLESMLHSVVAGLQKIEQGTYGQCEQCGKPIQAKRLEAFPAANYCMKCQSQNS